MNHRRYCGVCVHGGVCVSMGGRGMFLPSSSCVLLFTFKQGNACKGSVLWRTDEKMNMDWRLIHTHTYLYYQIEIKLHANGCPPSIIVMAVLIRIFFSSAEFVEYPQRKKARNKPSTNSMNPLKAFELFLYVCQIQLCVSAKYANQVFSEHRHVCHSPWHDIKLNEQYFISNYHVTFLTIKAYVASSGQQTGFLALKHQLSSLEAWNAETRACMRKRKLRLKPPENCNDTDTLRYNQ